MIKKLFNNILIPFNEEQDAELSVREAIRLAGGWPCNIHLLHILKGSDAAEGQAVHLLRAVLQEKFRLGPGSSLSLLATFQQGVAEQLIIDYYLRNEIDLVLLAPGRRGFWRILSMRKFVNIGRLLRKIECPVMTVFQQPAFTVFKNIVLPVGEELPMRKLLFATYLAKMAHATIHLVSLDHKTSDRLKNAPESLYRSYRLLRENTNLPVECLTMPGFNLAESSWQYAQKIKADLILIHSGKECLLSGFLDDLRTHPAQGLYSRALFNVSRIPVITFAG